jgi:ubiquinone biosynthesis monooxygenase Coq7
MDPLLISIDNALRTLFSRPLASKPLKHNPDEIRLEHEKDLTQAEQHLSGALMRVNHVGEVCAQALYASQGLATSNKALKTFFNDASKDEFDHLAWTEGRLDELKDHKSYLNPVWYVGAFGIGYLAGKLGGDKMSLGFVAETERQVSEHLRGHLSQLPAGDTSSREIVKQMIVDEEGHAKLAESKGAQELPPPLKLLMRAAGKVMTTTAHYI